jgi:dTDP-4-amino-4,6-dideoxygalactose transaminase
MSLFPVFEQRFVNPEAEKVEKRGISLAAAGNLTQEDVAFVCDSLLKIIGKN